MENPIAQPIIFKALTLFSIHLKDHSFVLSRLEC